MKRTVCFGEIMMRLNPDGHLRFVQADRFMVSYAGGEASVAVSLANFGLDSSFVTKLPTHELGQAAVNALRKQGVVTKHILRGDRLGVYFLEKGASQRASKVIYDRTDSAVALAQPEEYPWDVVMENADWFHFSGITPALGERAAAACLEACKAAKKAGASVSCDLNYRKKLWSREDARRVMTGLMPYVDVLIANEEDASDVFGIAPEDTDIESGKLSQEGYVSVAKQLVERFGFHYVAITLRGSISASDNHLAAMLYDGKNAHFSRNYLIHIVDRVGGGDSFAGGLIYALLEEMPLQKAISFAAASCLKQTIEYDFNQVSVAEVEALMQGNDSGRVQR